MARAGALRKPTNVSARADLVAEAKSLGINLSEVFENALEASVQEVRCRQWVTENKEAFADYDRFVEANGVFSKGKKLF